MGGERITTNTTTASNTTPKKVMVVVDPTRESAAALQYSLSHAVIDCDEVILLHVDNPNSWKNAITTFLKRPNGGPANSHAAATPIDNAASDAGGGGPTDVDFLKEMKKVCNVARPELKVRTARVEMEGKDKAAMIMAQTKALDIDLLVIGQRRSLSTAILGYKRAGVVKMLDTAEYLIENSNCTCVAVQKKGQNAGYLLNTKTHRNFWLLA
ncbi:uncharacterized protein LOC111473211 isoform X2 [Cucurbita maxima]|uniref:Uncharacterized protein LOC111473211 isoform X1 n=1 Tax=Cucurbita maxima TaxID=3661 RepID=A0A6J1IE79_CUCMA|nr:uncharacterized protein LOC111473211 isoform X1 [Cucurbita maxima]XP_022974545.1 uncharacterized protein LOC111473211 isoform X2 [Cucurbita maxima]